MQGSQPWSAKPDTTRRRNIVRGRLSRGGRLRCRGVACVVLVTSTSREDGGVLWRTHGEGQTHSPIHSDLHQALAAESLPTLT